VAATIIPSQSIPTTARPTAAPAPSRSGYAATPVWRVGALAGVVAAVATTVVAVTWRLAQRPARA
jgi:hypothetical protein